MVICRLRVNTLNRFQVAPRIGSFGISQIIMWKWSIFIIQITIWYLILNKQIIGAYSSWLFFDICHNLRIHRLVDIWELLLYHTIFLHVFDVVFDLFCFISYHSVVSHISSSHLIAPFLSDLILSYMIASYLTLYVLVLWSISLS